METLLKQQVSLDTFVSCFLRFVVIVIISDLFNALYDLISVRRN